MLVEEGVLVKERVQKEVPVEEVAPMRRKRSRGGSTRFSFYAVVVFVVVVGDMIITPVIIGLKLVIRDMIIAPRTRSLASGSIGKPIARRGGSRVAKRKERGHEPKLETANRKVQVSLSSFRDC